MKSIQLMLSSQFLALGLACAGANEDLRAAAGSGNADSVQLALKAGADVNGKDAQGATPLMVAATMGNTEAVRVLIAAKADVNAKTAMGYSALTMSNTKRHLESVKLLLDAKADPNTKTTIGYTPLIMLTMLGGHVDVAKALLAAGAKVDAKDLVGNTALAMLARSGIEPAEKIQRLTQGKVLRNEQEADYSPLAEIAKALIDAGADVNDGGKIKQTPLMLASEKGRTDFVKLLLDSKADPKAFSINKKTALLYACNSGHADIVKLLIAKGADVNLKYKSPGDDKYNCVMIAAMNGFLDVTQALIDAHADLNEKTKHEDKTVTPELDGAIRIHTTTTTNTALSLAFENKHMDVVELLKKHGAKAP